MGRLRTWLFVAGATMAAGACGDDDEPPVVVASTATGPSTGLGPTSSTTPPSEPPDDSGLAASFGTVLVELVSDAGAAVRWCLLDADTTVERSKGLMGVTDLEGHEGMLFSVVAPTKTRFFMFDTPSPLRIGFFDEEGSALGTADMVPCTTESSSCVRYAAPAPWTWAVEVFAGTAESTRLAAGRSLSILDDEC